MYPYQQPKAKIMAGGPYGPASDGGMPGTQNTQFVAYNNRYANIGSSYFERQNIIPQKAQEVLAARRAPRRQFALRQWYKPTAWGYEKYRADPRGLLGGPEAWQASEDYLKNLSLRSRGAIFTKPQKTPLGKSLAEGGFNFEPRGSFMSVLDPMHPTLEKPLYRGY